MLAPVWANWPLTGIKALTTTRCGGVSHEPFAGLNLGDHVNDATAAVAENRRRLQSDLKLPSAPVWLRQTHSTTIVDAARTTSVVSADGSFSGQRQQVCAVLTADCLPILLANPKHGWVAALHAGWRGLADGIIEQLAEQVDIGAGTCAWIGPAISGPNFVVQRDVVDYFVATDSDYERFFQPFVGGYHGDLIGIARHKLATMAIAHYGGEHCTYADAERFYSYRRDGETGRMASLIWME